MGYFMHMNNSNEFENWCILLGAGCFCWKRKNRTLICVFLISWLKKGKCKIRMFKADIRAPFGFFLTSNFLCKQNSCMQLNQQCPVFHQRPLATQHIPRISSCIMHWQKMCELAPFGAVIIFTRSSRATHAISNKFSNMFYCGYHFFISGLLNHFIVKSYFKYML